MNYDEVISFYNEKLEAEQTTLNRLKNQIFKIGTIRLCVVVACIILSYFMWGNVSTVSIIIGSSVIIYLALMKFHSKLFNAKTYSEIYIKNCKNELQGLNYDFSAFDGAEDMIDAEHSYSLDLDLFGKKSLFQSINRTVSSFGKTALGDSFIIPLNNRDEILKQQEAIKELTHKRNLLLHFRSVGQMETLKNIGKTKFSESLKHDSPLKNSKVWISLIYIIPSIYIILAFLVGFDILGGSIYLPLYLLCFAIAAIPSKKVTTIKDKFEQKSDVLNSYAKMLSIIENESFKSEILQDLHTKLNIGNKASKAISKLHTLHGNLEMAYSYPILLILNPVLLWNIRSAIAIEQWADKYKDQVDDWFTTLGEFDKLVSLATFAFNHPDYTYPLPTETFSFSGKKLGHPLINRDTCVRNDIDMTKTPYFLVITGANMAGKSTYLRTIGVNHVLACMGAPVCAESLSFYPNNLVTNLRTADSLADNESYFFAELKRLKMIIDRLKSGEEIFIILDEILKGTNSEDKRKGSIALMKQLVSLNGNGIIATHDLELGHLEQEYPNNVKDFCFEADITNDQLSFTYKIREGIAQNMNATFLMRKMGITGL